MMRIFFTRKLVVIASLLFLSYQVSGQTIVSTQPEMRKALLEKFTGINCGHCPRGHDEANALIDQHINNVFVVGVHTGTFSVPNPDQEDFRVPYGDTLRSKIAGVGVYPSGIVNRFDFKNVGHSQILPSSRGNWSSQVDSILKLSSPANIGVEATYYESSRNLEIHTEVYYTDDSPGDDVLQIMILENKRGYQQDYDFGAQSNYLHQHILRIPVNGFDGETVNTTNQGDLFSKTYSLNIPSDLEADSLEVLAFIGDSYYDIYNVAIVKANDFISSVTPLDRDLSEFDVFPNPADQYLNVKLKALNQSISVLNSLGKLLLNSTNNKLDHRIDVSDLPNGVYFIRVGGENDSQVKRFIKY